MKLENLSFEHLQKMIFMYNALEKGWCIKKINDSYYFKKPHENKEEIFSDTFLSNFVKENTKLDKLLSNNHD
jgi:hypothetical protein